MKQYHPIRKNAGSALKTTLETNIAPEHQWLEDDISFWDGLLFLGAMLDLGSVTEQQNILLPTTPRHADR